jgi:hypothetical protein
MNGKCKTSGTPLKDQTSLEHIGIGNNFLNRTPVTQHLIERIDKCDYMKLKTSAQQRK